MKILHVLPHMPKAAGTSVFCGEIACEQVKEGHEVIVAVTNPADENLYPLADGVRRVSVAEVLAGKLNDVDVVHIHSIWWWIYHRVCTWAVRRGIPIVWSPHGTLTPWAMHHKGWKKWPAWRLWQKRDLSCARFLHVTEACEVKNVRDLGLKNELAVVPLGVRPASVPHLPRTDGRRTLLFVSRVQKKKGLPNLVEAWSRLPEEVRKGWEVRIVGPDEANHVAELRAQCDRLGVSFTFVGQKTGEDLAREYASADLFVLPTLSENFGSVVLEAMVYGLPVITTKGAPWAVLEEQKAGWWVDVGVEGLVTALTAALRMSSEDLQAMGARGKRFALEEYSWTKSWQMLRPAYEKSLKV